MCAYQKIGRDPRVLSTIGRCPLQRMSTIGRFYQRQSLLSLIASVCYTFNLQKLYRRNCARLVKSKKVNSLNNEVILVLKDMTSTQTCLLVSSLGYVYLYVLSPGCSQIFGEITLYGIVLIFCKNIYRFHSGNELAMCVNLCIPTHTCCE